MNTSEDYRWSYILRRWPDVSYRVQGLIHAHIDAEPWIAYGEGLELEFRRRLDGDDIERLDVSFDYLGRFKAVRRSKIIQVERCRSIADLERMLERGAK